MAVRTLTCAREREGELDLKEKYWNSVGEFLSSLAGCTVYDGQEKRMSHEWGAGEPTPMETEETENGLYPGATCE